VRRLLIRSLLAGTLGLLTTLAAAWSFAARADWSSGWPETVFRREFDRRWAGGLRYIILHSTHQRGLCRWRVGTFTQGLGQLVSISESDKGDPEARAPHWARDALFPWEFEGLVLPQAGRLVTIVAAAGWPALAFWCEDLSRGASSSPRGAGGIVLPQTFGNQAYLVTGTRILPYRVIWSGAFLDTVAFGVPWFVVLCVPGPVRRAVRRRRGHCVRCGYDLKCDFTAGCPECGWNRESKAVCSLH
jgi:hypothetical protein